MGDYYETFRPPFFLSSNPYSRLLAINSRAYERDDEAIITDLSKHIAAQHGIDTRGVRICSQNGVVELTGSVASSPIRKYLGKIAENILGVRDVDNKLQCSDLVIGH